MKLVAPFRSELHAVEQPGGNLGRLFLNLLVRPRPSYKDVWLNVHREGE